MHAVGRLTGVLLLLSVPGSGVRRRSDGLVGIGRVLAHRVLPPVSWRHKIGGSVARRRTESVRNPQMSDRIVKLRS